MTYIIISFVVSFISQLILLLTKNLHIKFTGDDNSISPHKSHKRTVPRVGGVGVFLAVLTATFLKTTFSENITLNFFFQALLCFFPIFFISILEDILKNVKILHRLFVCIIGTVLTIYILEISITRTDLFFIDYLLLNNAYFAVVFTVFAIVGLINSYNISDGLNGLASFCATLALFSMAYVTYVINDFSVLIICLIILAAIFGFTMFNYPKGLIFLGDSGAYLIGYLISIISIHLSSKFNEISPWFFILINAYPITDTIFSIFRRYFRKHKTSITTGDGFHLHTLLYRRHFSSDNLSNGNSMATMFVLPLPITSAAVAVLFYKKTLILIPAYIVFFLIYLYIYKTLINFRTPRLMNYLIDTIKK